MAIDVTLLKPENLVATSPNGLTATPTALTQNGDVWSYKFGQLGETGVWQITLATALYGKPAGTLLGTIEVRQGTVYEIAIPWNEVSNPQIDLNKIAIANANTAIATLTQTLNDATGDIAVTEADVEQLKTDLNEEVTDRTTAIAALNTRVDTDKTVIDDAIAVLDGDVQTLKADVIREVAERTAAVTNANTRISAVTKTADDATDAITLLNTEVQQLETEIDKEVTDRTAAISSIEAEIVTLKTEDSTITREVDDLISTLAGVQATANSAAKQTDLEAEIATLESADTKLSNKLDKLTTELATVESTAAKQVDLDAFEDAVNQNVAALNTELNLKAKQTDLDKTNAAIAGLYRESENAPDLDIPEWRFWNQIETLDSNRRSRLYYRIVSANDAILIHDTTYSILVTEQDAIEISPGQFEVTLHEGTKIKYSNSRNGDLMSFEFTAGIYRDIESAYLDSSENILQAGYRAEMIASTQTAHGLGRQAAPPGAVAVRFRLFKPDHSYVEYKVTLV